jgi:hypothetical protein
MKLKSTFFAVALAVSSLSAQAATYSFSQSGFAGGGSVTGSFSGVDLDLNGILDASFGEISLFSLSFSGGSVAPFSLGYSDLVGLTYQLNSGNFIGDNGQPNTGEGIAASNAQWSYLAGVGPLGVTGGQIGDAFFTPLTTTSSLVSVASVPEPESFAMMLAGLGLIGFVARRRRAG